MDHVIKVIHNIDSKANKFLLQEITFDSLSQMKNNNPIIRYVKQCCAPLLSTQANFQVPLYRLLTSLFKLRVNTLKNKSITRGISWKCMP